MSRTLHQDLSEVPILVEPAVPETFIPGQSDAPAEDEHSEKPTSAPTRDEARPEIGRAGGAGGSAGTEPLSERDRAVLIFEKQYWKYTGAKEQAIRDRFEMSATRYYQVLNALLDRPEAQEFEPMLVKRLRRQRAARQRARSGRAQPRPRP
jgi:hypothetical protein